MNDDFRLYNVFMADFLQIITVGIDNALSS